MPLHVKSAQISMLSLGSMSCWPRVWSIRTGLGQAPSQNPSTRNSRYYWTVLTVGQFHVTLTGTPEEASAALASAIEN